MIQIAVMGHGVVGGGVTEILLKHADSIAKKLGEDIYIKKVLDLREFPDSPIADRFTKDFSEIISDSEISVVVEVMGGLNPAYTFVKECLEKGKSVVTSNKELVAAKGAELLAIAEEKNVNFLFEASVGGGIPIIRPLHQCLAANDIEKINGILNGTTNFILNKMIKDNMSFEDALALAQEKGYAEKNPAADVEGHDACRKICILASLVYGTHVYPESVHTEGITKVSLRDVEYAQAWGGAVKLIASAKKSESEPDKQEIIVAPMFVSSECQLVNVDGVYNEVLVRGDCTGTVGFYGRGAGKLPTASAVVADVMDCVLHKDERRSIMWKDGSGENVVSYKNYVNSMYVLASTDNKADALERANALFGKCETITLDDANEHELAFITPELPYGDFKERCKAFGEVCALRSVIRVAKI
ncbi:MAG: homoserine dehydrogenase [Clostridia bacterium]|nr:homoserine dehydrogenase [Clostridia bacterium]